MGVGYACVFVEGSMPDTTLEELLLVESILWIWGGGGPWLAEGAWI